jgi:hypothetical protein
MEHPKGSLLVLIAAATLAAVAAFAQQSPNADKATATAPSQPAASPGSSQPADASADTQTADSETAKLIAAANAAAAAKAAKSGASAASDSARTAALTKQARETGWHPETKRGDTVYCREDPVVGSRFPTRRCVTASQLTILLEQATFDKDAVSNRSCGGSSCSGGK